MADVTDERLANLISWTSKAGMPDVHHLLLENRDHRAARAADEDRIRAVVDEALNAPGAPVRTSAWCGSVAARIASQLATAATDRAAIARHASTIAELRSEARAAYAQLRSTISRLASHESTEGSEVLIAKLREAFVRLGVLDSARSSDQEIR